MKTEDGGKNKGRRVEEAFWEALLWLWFVVRMWSVVRSETFHYRLISPDPIALFLGSQTQDERRRHENKNDEDGDRCELTRSKCW